MSDGNGTLDTSRGSDALYKAARIAFQAKGWSLNRWCRENAVVFTSARNALLGWGDTEKMQQLRQRIVKEAGIVTEPQKIGE